MQHSFYQLFSSEDAYYEASSEFKAKVKQCDDDTPPSRNTSKVKDLCTITVKLDVPYEALEDFYGAQGKMLKKLDYTVEMVPSGASIDFAVLYDGIKLGSQNARVEFE